jgi:hypothetical protein
VKDVGLRVSASSSWLLGEGEGWRVKRLGLELRVLGIEFRV